jgi:hypothetical protein
VVVTGFDPVEFAVGDDWPRVVKAGGTQRGTEFCGFVFALEVSRWSDAVFILGFPPRDERVHITFEKTSGTLAVRQMALGQDSVCGKTIYQPHRTP